MNAYVKYFDKNNKCINLLNKDEEILKEYNEIWNKIGRLLKRGTDSKPVYNDKFIKTKIEIYNDQVYTNFQNNTIPKYFYMLICSIIIFVVKLFAVVNILKKSFTLV